MRGASSLLWCPRKWGWSRMTDQKVVWAGADAGSEGTWQQWIILPDVLMDAIPVRTGKDRLVSLQPAHEPPEPR